MNFRERPKGELRRTPLLGSSVDNPRQVVFPKTVEPGVKIRSSDGLLLGGLRQGFEHYLVTESLQLPNQSLRVCLAGSLPLEIILAKLLIVHFALQHMVSDHQDRVPDCHRRFLRTMPASEASVLRRKVGPLGARRSPSRLGQRAPEPLRALTGLARATFARRLLVTGTHARPRRKMLVGGKLIHVHPDLCDQGLSHPAVHAQEDRKSTRLNSSHANISYAVFCLQK